MKAPNQFTSLPMPERFWSKVLKTPTCWIWIATRNTTGYGQFSLFGKLVVAHRVSYELSKGPIPTGLRVLHHCDNPPCVRPSHLWLGTQKMNMEDASSKDRFPVRTGKLNPFFGRHHTQSEVMKLKNHFRDSSGRFSKPSVVEVE